MEDDAAMPSTGERNYEVRQLVDEDAVRARDMLSQYFWSSMPSASEGELTQAILNLSVVAWQLCSLIFHIYFLLLFPSFVCLVGSGDVEEDPEVAASGSGDEDKEQQVQTRATAEEGQGIII
jgi:hypothetical protein